MIWLLLSVYILIAAFIFGVLADLDQKDRFPTTFGSLFLMFVLALVWPFSLAMGLGIQYSERYD